MEQASLFWRVLSASIVSLVLSIIILVVTNTDSSSTTFSGGSVAAGPQMLFLRNSGQAAELWLADGTGTGLRLLQKDVTAYAVSGDGRKIIYARQVAEGPSRLEIFDLFTNKNEILVWESDFGAYGAEWSPVGEPGIIAYERRVISTAGLGQPKLWLIDSDGNELGPVMRGGDVISYNAGWSPDGTRLAFIDPLRSELGIFNFSEQIRTIPFAGEYDWSPDGQKLVISNADVSKAEQQTTLEIYDLQAGTSTQLFVEPNANDYTPRWSPDGNSIAFVRRTIDHPYGTIWVGDIATGEARPISGKSSDSAVDDNDPQWSPDNSQVMWSRFGLGAQAAAPGLWIGSRDGSTEPRLLIENATRGEWFTQGN